MSRTPRSADGRMTLLEHFAEFRTRLFRAMLGLLGGMIVGFVFYKPIWSVLRRPYCDAIGHHGAQNQCELYYHTFFEPLMLQFKVALIVGAIVSSPIWLYQLWAFVTPGLVKRERRWALTFVAIAVPLFVAGASLAYFVMSKGMAILLSFAPKDSAAIIGLGAYLKYFTAMLLIFGAAFEVPLLIVLLNRAGVLTYEQLHKHRRLSIVLVFVFGAVATPSGDPFTMIALAIPMTILLELATQVARLHDRRAAKRVDPDLLDLDDDATSPLDLTPSDVGGPADP